MRWLEFMHRELGITCSIVRMNWQVMTWASKRMVCKAAHWKMWGANASACPPESCSVVNAC